MCNEQQASLDESESRRVEVICTSQVEGLKVGGDTTPCGPRDRDVMWKTEPG